MGVGGIWGRGSNHGAIPSGDVTVGADVKLATGTFYNDNTKSHDYLGVCRSLGGLYRM